MTKPKWVKSYNRTVSTMLQDDLVYEDGKSKSGKHADWIDKNRNLARDLGALKRHLDAALIDAENETYHSPQASGIDKDSGAYHLAHVRARAGIIIDNLEDRKCP